MVDWLVKAGKAAASGYLTGQLRKGIEYMARRGITYAKRKYYGRRGGGRRYTKRDILVRAGKRTARMLAPLTTQRDAQTLSRRSRSSGVSLSFQRRVRAALQNDMPPRIYQELFKGSDNDINGTQGYKGVYLMDLNTTDQGQLWNVFKDAYGLATVADAENKSVFLRSACLDFQIRNADATNEVYITMYTVVARRDVDGTSSLGDFFTTYFADMAAIGAVAPNIAAMSPYDNPGFIRHWKVLRAVRVKIKPLETASFQIRKRLNRKIQGRILQDQDCAIRGLTHGLFFQMRGSPTNSAATSGLSAYSVTYSAQTTIHYRQTAGDASADTIGQTK